MKKPSHLSWSEAAGIPEVFLTGERRTRVRTCRCVNLLQAFQALFLSGDLKQGDNVLVHAGASGVGVAVIQLARVFGALVNVNYYVNVLLNSCAHIVAKSLRQRRRRIKLTGSTRLTTDQRELPITRPKTLRLL